MMDPSQTSDVLLLGGGLAGLTAALHLAGAGLRVRVLEKGDYPRHKVCGEYVSNEVLPYLSELGFDPFAHGATRLKRCLLSTAGGATVTASLPLGGFGLSRYCMDAALRDLVIARGGEVIKTTVTGVAYADGLFSVTTRAGTSYVAPVAIGAFGKRSKLDYALERPFTAQAAPYLGVKAHYAGDFPPDLVALYNFRGGYCGVSKVEEGHVNVCYLADYATFQVHKNLEDYEREVVRRNPRLNDVLDRLSPLFDRPLAISGISFARKELVREHILTCGDAAGMIHPLSGNGMGMAVGGARMLATAVEGYFQHGDRARLERDYTRAWRGRFRKRLLFGRAFNALFYQPTLFSGAMRLLTAFPQALPFFIRQTHE